MTDFKTVYTAKEIIEFAVDELGTRTQVAAVLGVSTSAMTKWCAKNFIPGTCASQLAQITSLGPWQVNPEIFTLDYAVSHQEMRLIQLIRSTGERLGEDLLKETLHQVKAL